MNRGCVTPSPPGRSVPPRPSEASSLEVRQQPCASEIYDDAGSADVEDGAAAEGVDPTDAEPEDAPPWD